MSSTFIRQQSLRRYTLVLMGGLLFVGSVWLPQRVRALITITKNTTCVAVADASNYVSDPFFGASIPSTASLDASLSDQFYSKAQISFSDSGGLIILSMATDQRRDGGLNDYVMANEGHIDFTAGKNTTYVATGNYNVDDPEGSSGFVFLTSYLYDVTLNQLLYRSTQISTSTNDESFVLGELGGDIIGSNFFSGSLTGNLFVGHKYRYYTQSLTEATPDADSGASAHGNFTLTIGETSVPEASSFLVRSLLGLTAGGAVWWRRREC